jgi:hypothetical protein
MNYALSFVCLSLGLFMTKIAFMADSVFVLLPALAIAFSGVLVFILETGDRIREYLAQRDADRARARRIELIKQGVR